ncbi:MAG: 30S ribosomal protein S4 [Clostridia bacterium]|nr:30S ribosomal protein S4 [Clostridia bacterium]
MAISRGPILKKCRALGIEPTVIGIDKKSNRKPKKNMRKLSEYGTQLKEKQKVKFIYGVAEKQFRNYFEKAAKTNGKTGELLLQTLELRLDNIAYRLGIGKSRAEARQLVTYEMLEVNGRKVNIPSYICREGDVITVRESKKSNKAIVDSLEVNKSRIVPSWIDFNKDKLEAKIVRRPVKEDLDFEVQESLIVELYSRN